MMAEWGIPFDHIENNWTDAQFMVMASMLAKRLQAEQNDEPTTINEQQFLRKTKGGQHGWSSG